MELVYRPSNVRRKVEPHSVEVTDHGQVYLIAWQRLGASASGANAGWKNFDLARIASAEHVPDGFDGPRAGFTPGFVGDEVICHVASQFDAPEQVDL